MITAMLHVPNVRAAIDWYCSIGFALRAAYQPESEEGWAAVTFEGGEVMFAAGGSASDAHRREVDLYIAMNKIDGHFAAIQARVDVVEPPHDTFYGMREFIIRDLNRFWITFGQPADHQTTAAT